MASYFYLIMYALFHFHHVHFIAHFTILALSILDFLSSNYTLISFYCTLYAFAFRTPDTVNSRHFKCNCESSSLHFAHIIVYSLGIAASEKFRFLLDLNSLSKVCCQQIRRFKDFYSRNNIICNYRVLTVYCEYILNI